MRLSWWWMFTILFYGSRHLAVLYAVTHWRFGSTYYLCLQGKTFPTLKMKGAFSTDIHLKNTVTLPRGRSCEVHWKGLSDEAAVFRFSGVTFILRPSNTFIQQIGHRRRFSTRESPKIKVRRVTIGSNLKNWVYLASWYQIICRGKNEGLSAAFRR